MGRVLLRMRQVGWWRADRLRVKIFLAIAGANALLAVLAYLVFTWSFDQGLVDYFNRADERRLTPLVNRLAEGHRQHGDWAWLSSDPRAFSDLVREVLGVGRMPRRDGGVSPTAAGPAPASAVAPWKPLPDPLLTIDPRLMLFDADRTLLIGRLPPQPAPVLRPIERDGRTVGYLGYLPQLRVVASLEEAFAVQQTRRFAAIGAGMLLASLLVGAVLAQWLSRRIGQLAAGAHRLREGRYETRLPVSGADELAELAQDFNALAAGLDEARRMRQQWLADIAHELRTPLAVLRAEIEAMQDGVRALDAAGLASLAQEVARLGRLVEDLRLLSLSDMGALHLQRPPLALGEVMAQALSAQQRAIVAAGCTLRTDVAQAVTVRGDAARLGQVFANLLQNSLRYTDAPGRLSISLRREGVEARVVWEDSEPGVAAADLARLTERLFRVDASRARHRGAADDGGSGLGLAISRAIVEGHGGRMIPSASPLGGLRWEIWLPLGSENEA